jgi:hypothetical protein
MKKIILLAAFTLLAVLTTYSQSFQTRTWVSEEGYLIAQVRETSGVRTPTTLDQFTDMIFQIYWPTSLGDVNLGNIICYSYPVDKQGSRVTVGSYYLQDFGHTGLIIFFPNNWTQNVWETILTMPVTFTGPGTGDFFLADNDFYSECTIGINYNGPGNTEWFTMTPNGFADDYRFPTVIYDYLWTGEVSTDWNNVNNWTIDKCDLLPPYNHPAVAPTSTTTCFIPSGKTNYPSGSAWTLAGVCGYLRVASGAYVSVPATRNLTIQNDLAMSHLAGSPGYLEINPDATVDVNGNIYLSGPSQIRVKADGTGVGSFINDGSIAHGATGSADVETYLTNAGGVGSYYMHQVGPTVNNPAYQSANGHPGVYLGQFDIVTLGTYAYRYLEGSNSWENIYPVQTPVPLTQGLILSTIDNTNHHLTMTGQLNTGNINTPFNLGHSGANVDLISNPYPSAIDFDLFQADNNTVVNTTFWIWNPANGSGNYETYTIGSGGLNSGEIQVGQSFFVGTNTSAPVQFQNDQRIHSTQPFVKDYYANQLRISMNGFDYGDAAFIHFKENATPGHDYTMDADKWFSIFDEATQVWTISSDMSALTMNAMPMLAEEPVSIPMNVKGGFEGEYTLTASQIESFPAGTQIFLEDLKTGGEWINLVQNPVYTFTGSPADDQARFVLHFFGPTGIADDLTSSDVQIYSSKQFAYVINNSGKQLKEYVVFDMSGRPVTSGTLSQSTVNRLYVSDITGYYVVKVTSASGEYYSGKVFIGR